MTRRVIAAENVKYWRHSGSFIFALSLLFACLCPPSPASMFQYLFSEGCKCRFPCLCWSDLNHPAVALAEQLVGQLCPENILIYGLFCWSPFQFMKCVAGNSLCIYELHKVDRTCKSQEKRHQGGESYPRRARSSVQSHGQVALCRTLCHLPPGSALWAGLSSAPWEGQRWGASKAHYCCV